MFKEYLKIPNIFKRDSTTKKLNKGEFSTPELYYLRDNEWVFTEKIDGTNIRICWDGCRVSFRGRTDRADIPKHLLERLEELFGGSEMEEVFEEVFGKTEVVLYGEGYGPKIQKGGGNYSDKVDFILFDILINNYYLHREDIEGIANRLNIQAVPIVLTGTLWDGVKYVINNTRSTFGTAVLEGIIGTPATPLHSRSGDRIIVKIKGRDFNEDRV